MADLVYNIERFIFLCNIPVADELLVARGGLFDRYQNDQAKINSWYLPE